MSDTPRTDALWREHVHFVNEDEAMEALCDFRSLCAKLETELAAERSTLAGVIMLKMHQEAELAKERARLEKIETALRDAISTYHGADKLVTAERIEAWQAALGDATP